MEKRILILGQSGFIGSNLAEYLNNHYLVDIPDHGQLDVLQEEEVFQYLCAKSYDVVINTLDITNEQDQYFEKRLRMYMNLEKFSSLYGKMIYFGSGAEYARELQIEQIVETQFNRKIPEDSYGFCLHQMAVSAIKSVNIYDFRLFGIFGKYELWKKRFISNSICKALYGYPITIRKNRCFDFLYIEDLCRIVEWAIENTPRFHDYNVVSGRKYELTALAEIIDQTVGNHVPIFVAENGIGKPYTASNERLCQEYVDFSPQRIEKSIEELTGWYRLHLNQFDRLSLLYQN